MVLRGYLLLFICLYQSLCFAQIGGDIDSTNSDMAFAIPEDQDYFEESLSDTVFIEEDEVYHESIESLNFLDIDSNLTTSTKIEEQHNLVKDVLADSLYWVGVDECFGLFDSMSVDPYGYDTTAFLDTLDRFLCMSKYGADGDWYFPIVKKTYVTSPFGFRRYKWHYGTDLKLEVGDTLVAAFDGVVRVAKYNPRGYGYYVIIRHHNGLETLYGHMSRYDVHVGQTLKAGEMIGLGGNTGHSTGSHLHFEVRYKGKAIDPAVFYNFEDECLETCDFTVTPEHFAYYRELSKAVYHRIRSGDYLGKIAARYHTSIGAICRLNNIRRTTVLRVGRTLRVR